MFLHASRKTFSNVKVSISAQWTPSVRNDSTPAFSPGEVLSTSRTEQHAIQHNVSPTHRRWLGSIKTKLKGKKVGFATGEGLCSQRSQLALPLWSVSKIRKQNSDDYLFTLAVFSLTVPDMGEQPPVCRWKAGHPVPGGAGLHLPLLVRSGEWQARFSVFNELLRGATSATETGRTGSSWWWHAFTACQVGLGWKPDPCCLRSLRNGGLYIEQVV